MNPQPTVSPIHPNAVTVVCCGDEQFAAPAGVLFRSILDLASADRFYDLIYLHNGLSPEKAAALESMTDGILAKIRCVDIRPVFDTQGLHTKNRRDISPMTYARLLIPEILSEDYTRALYLDGDMILFRDVAALFDCDLGDYPLASSTDIGFLATWNRDPHIRQYGETVLGIRDPQRYFMAGLLLMDLTQLRRLFPQGALMELARSRQWIWHDQDVLNVALRDRIHYLDPRWDVIAPEGGTQALPEDWKILHRQLMDAPYLFHFAGIGTKPWENLNTPFADAFWQVAVRTPFYSELICRLCSFDNTYSTLYSVPQGKIRNLLRRILPPPVDSIQRDLKNLLNTLDDHSRLLLTLLGRLTPEVPALPLPPEDTPLPILPAFSDGVTLVCCGDDYFTAPTGVLLRSVIAHSDPNRHYDLIYLHDGISRDSRSRLFALADGHPNISLRICDIRPVFEKTGLFTENRKNFSPMAYARLLIPEILGPGYVRALYLDGDMVATDDIAHLFDLPLGSNPLGACRDLHLLAQSKLNTKAIRRRLDYTRDVLGISDPAQYIISGMLLMDLEALRRESAAQTLLTLARSRQWLWHDQDVINCHFHGRITLLPGRWNLCHLREARDLLPPERQEEYDNALGDPGICHFAGAGEKPWLRLYPDFAPVFWAAARQTPFYHLLLRRLKQELSTYHRYNPKEGGSTPMLKRFLKKILPPPVNSVQRDLKYVLDAIDEQKKLGLVLMQQIDQLQTSTPVPLAAKVPQTKLQFEFSLARHCNLNCAGCSHFSPLAPESFPDFEESRRAFQRLSQLFAGECEFIHLMGGEPLLNEDLEDYFTLARECFPRGKIYLITNGLLLPKMDDHFYQVCAREKIILSVTRYPIALDHEAIRRRCESHGVTYEFFRGEEAHTHFNRVALDPAGAGNIHENYVNCPHSNNCLYLRGSRMYPCGIGANMDLFQDHFRSGLEGLEEAGVDIFEVSSGRELLNRLAAPSSLCRYCGIHRWQEQIPWGHSRREIGEWT